MIELAHPGWLLLALALPPWAWLAWRSRAAADQGPQLRHPDLQQLPPAAARSGGAPIVLRTLAFACFILAAAQPQQPGPWIQPPPVGRDIALVVDTSLTMSLEDFRHADGQGVSRMAVLQQVMGDFVAQRPADRFSLAVFGSEAALLTPPTFDAAAVRAQLQRLQVGVLGDDTALGDALGLSLRALRAGELPPVLVLVSDGEPSNAGAMTPAEALAVARQLGVAIHTLQVGPPPRPGPPGEAPQPTLAEIASLSGGGHWTVRGSADAAAVMQAIDRLAPTLSPPAREREVRAWYALPLALGLACLMLAQLLAAGTRRAWGAAP